MYAAPVLLFVYTSHKWMKFYNTCNDLFIYLPNWCLVLYSRIFSHYMMAASITVGGSWVVPTGKITIILPVNVDLLRINQWHIEVGHNKV